MPAIRPPTVPPGSFTPSRDLVGGAHRPRGAAVGERTRAPRPRAIRLRLPGRLVAGCDGPSLSCLSYGACWLTPLAGERMSITWSTSPRSVPASGGRRLDNRSYLVADQLVALQERIPQSLDDVRPCPRGPRGHRRGPPEAGPRAPCGRRRPRATLLTMSKEARDASSEIRLPAIP